MGIEARFAMLTSIVCTVVWAVARIISLLIVLRGTEPAERAKLVRALADFYRPLRQLGKKDDDPPPSDGKV